MNEQKQPTEPGCAPASGSANDLLLKWKTAIQNRDNGIQSRKDNWMLPPIGIEEAMHMTREDVNAILWFLDKTLTLLAEHENSPNERDQRPGT